MFWAFQDGIKKDPTTFSYFFVTSGLAFLALLFLSIVCDYFRCIKSTRFLVMSGQNPMIAYVVGDLLIMPLINLLGLASLLSYFQQNAWLGFLQGVILTSLAVLATMFFTKIKWFWRTWFSKEYFLVYIYVCFVTLGNIDHLQPILFLQDAIQYIYISFLVYT